MNIDSRLWRLLAWLVLAPLPVCQFLALSKGKWTNAGLIGLFTAIGLGYLLLRSWLPRLFDFLVALMALVSGTGWTYDLYHEIWHYDEFAHAMAVFTLTLVSGFYFYRPLLGFFGNHRALLTLTFFNLGMSIGGLWEVVEWLIFGAMDYGDMITDLVADGVGALLAVPLALRTFNDPSGRWRLKKDGLLRWHHE